MYSSPNEIILSSCLETLFLTQYIAEALSMLGKLNGFRGGGCVFLEVFWSLLEIKEAVQRKVMNFASIDVVNELRREF